jgi:hypothetical protein
MANKRHTAEPIFVSDGVTFCHIQTSKMFFVLTTVKNMQCTMLMELLQGVSRVFKDYCGVLTGVVTSRLTTESSLYLRLQNSLYNILESWQEVTSLYTPLFT